MQRNVRVGLAAPVVAIVFAASCDVFEIEAVSRVPFGGWICWEAQDVMGRSAQKLTFVLRA